jgi:hypothetical protein
MKHSLLPLETHSILRQVKDSLGLKAPAAHKIMCKSRTIYTGKMRCIIKERMAASYRPQAPPSVAWHSIKQNTGYFEDTTVVSDLPYYTAELSRKQRKTNSTETVAVSQVKQQ